MARRNQPWNRLQPVLGVANLNLEEAPARLFVQDNRLMGRCFTYVLGDQTDVGEEMYLSALRPVFYTFYSALQGFKLAHSRARAPRLLLSIGLSLEGERQELDGNPYNFDFSENYTFDEVPRTDQTDYEVRLARDITNFRLQYNYPVSVTAIRFCITLVGMARANMQYVQTVGELSSLFLLRFLGGHLRRNVVDIPDEYYRESRPFLREIVNTLYNPAFFIRGNPLEIIHQRRLGNNFQWLQFTVNQRRNLAEAWNQRLPAGGCNVTQSFFMVNEGIFKLVSHKSSTSRAHRGWATHMKHYPPPADTNNCFFVEMDCHHHNLFVKNACKLRKQVLGQQGYEVYSPITTQDAVAIAEHMNVRLKIWDTEGECLAQTRFDPMEDNPYVLWTALVLHEGHYYTPIRINEGFLPPEINTTAAQRSNDRYRRLNEWKARKQQEARARLLEKNRQEAALNKEIERTEDSLIKVGTKAYQELETSKELWTFDHVLVYDLETCADPVTGELSVYAVGFSFSDRKFQYYIGEDCMKSFIQMLLGLNERHILVGFNSANFDNLFLLEELTKHAVPIHSLLMAGNRILQLTFGDKGHAVWDLMQMLGPNTLAKYCKDFKIDEDIAKTIFPHKAVTSPKMFDPTGQPAFVDQITYSDFFEKDVRAYPEEAIALMAFQPFPLQEVMLDYLRRDIMATLELCHITYSIYFEAYSVNCLHYSTYSQIAYALMLTSIPPEIKLFSIKLGDDYDAIREAYFGGMTYPTKQYFESDQFVQVIESPETFPFDEVTDYLVDCDVNSLYPYACMQTFPVGECSHEVYTTPIEYTSRPWIGFVKITYRGNPELLHPILAKRCKNTIQWTNEDCLVPRWYCTVDVDTAVILKYADIRVHEGYLFNQTYPIFRAFIEQALEIKDQGTREGNPSKRSIGKNNANCVYGKTGQKEYRQETVLIQTEDDFTALFERRGGRVVEMTPVGKTIALAIFQDENQSHAKRPHYIAAWVTALARQRMSELMRAYDPNLGKDLKKSFECGMYNMDTDSMHLHFNQYQTLLGQGHIHDSELGKLKNDLAQKGKEARIVRAVYLSPKVYHLELVERTDDGFCKLRTHTACKGVNLDVLKQLNQEMMMDSESRHIFFDLYFWRHENATLRVDMPPNMKHQKGIKEGRLPYKKMNTHFFRTLNKTQYSGRYECPVDTWLIPKGSERIVQGW